MPDHITSVPKYTTKDTCVKLYGLSLIHISEADAARYAMEQEAEGIRARGLAEAEAIEKKAEAQRKMGEASILEMYLAALPEVDVYKRQALSGSNRP